MVTVLSLSVFFLLGMVPDCSRHAQPSDVLSRCPLALFLLSFCPAYRWLSVPLSRCSVLSCPVLRCAVLCCVVLFCRAQLKLRRKVVESINQYGRPAPAPGVIVEDRRGGARSAPNGPDTAATSSVSSASWLWLWISTAPRSSGCHARMPEERSHKGP